MAASIAKRILAWLTVLVLLGAAVAGGYYGYRATFPVVLQVQDYPGAMMVRLKCIGDAASVTNMTILHYRDREAKKSGKAAWTRNIGRRKSEPVQLPIDLGPGEDRQAYLDFTFYQIFPRDLRTGITYVEIRTSASRFPLRRRYVPTAKPET
jgi:hypothetical protein